MMISEEWAVGKIACFYRRFGRIGYSITFSIEHENRAELQLVFDPVAEHPVKGW